MTLTGWPIRFSLSDQMGALMGALRAAFHRQHGHKAKVFGGRKESTMTKFQISEHAFQRGCESIAEEIIDEFKGDLKADEALADHENEISDRVWEYVDGHQWVIYHYKALKIAAECNVNNGEEFLEDVGMPETPTLSSIASMVVFGEMRARVERKIYDMIRETSEAA
jgi:hypothetical protein